MADGRGGNLVGAWTPREPRRRAPGLHKRLARERRMPGLADRFAMRPVSRGGKKRIADDTEELASVRAPLVFSP